MDSTFATGLNFRARAMLRAVAAGRAEVALSKEPDLFVDGLPCCDQYAAHLLVHEGLIRPSRLGVVGQRIPAALTPAGQSLVAGPTAA